MTLITNHCWQLLVCRLTRRSSLTVWLCILLGPRRVLVCHCSMEYPSTAKMVSKRVERRLALMGREASWIVSYLRKRQGSIDIFTIVAASKHDGVYADSFVDWRLGSVFKQVFWRLGVYSCQGEGVIKNLLVCQEFNTYRKSYQKMINNEMIRDRRVYSRFIKSYLRLFHVYMLGF